MYLKLKTAVAGVAVVAATAGATGVVVSGRSPDPPSRSVSASVFTGVIQPAAEETEPIIHVNELPETADASLQNVRARPGPVKLTQVPVIDVVEFIRQGIKVRLVVDRSAMERAGFAGDREVTVAAERLEEVLDQVRSASNERLAYAYHGPSGLIVITAAERNAADAARRMAESIHLAWERMQRARKEAGAVGNALAQPIGVPLDASGVPMEDWLTFLSNISGLEISIAASLDEAEVGQREVLDLNLPPDTHLGVVLQAMLELGAQEGAPGLLWVVRDGELVIVPEPTLETPLDFAGVTLEEALRTLAATGSEIQIDAEALNAAGIDPEAFRAAQVVMDASSGTPLGRVLWPMVRQAHPDARVAMTPSGDYLVTAGQVVD